MPYLKVLTISGEYPPARGGIGRYTDNLVKAIRNYAEVIVACAQSNVTNDKNVYSIIQAGDYRNSERILSLIKEFRPDIVHVQYEPLFYDRWKQTIFGVRPRSSTLQNFYHSSDVPVVTTAHSIFPYPEFEEFFDSKINRRGGRFEFLPLSFRIYVRKWYLRKSYDSLLRITKFSKHFINLNKATQDIIGHGRLIYIGSAPAFTFAVDKQKLREELGLPPDKMLLLAFGFATHFKGFDILNDITMPKGWALVVKQTPRAEKPIPIQNAINLSFDYLDEQGLSKLFFACDAMIFPRKIASGSGVLFDALAHGLPFVATNLTFFREFAELGLGVVAERNPESFNKAIEQLASNYSKFVENVEQFKPQLTWDTVAKKHIEVYSDLISNN